MTTKTQKLNSKKSRIFFPENKQSKHSVETTNQAQKNVWMNKSNWDLISEIELHCYQNGSKKDTVEKSLILVFEVIKTNSCKLKSLANLSYTSWGSNWVLTLSGTWRTTT